MEAASLLRGPSEVLGAGPGPGLEALAGGASLVPVGPALETGIGRRSPFSSSLIPALIRFSLHGPNLGQCEEPTCSSPLGAVAGVQTAP